MKWYYQHIPGDSHDMDESFERILIDYDGKRSLFSMGKLGILRELDRVTGEFRRAIDLGYQNILDVDPRTGEVTHRDGMLSDVGEELFFCPSTGGYALTFNARTRDLMWTGTYRDALVKTSEAGGSRPVNSPLARRPTASRRHLVIRASRRSRSAS